VGAAAGLLALLGLTGCISTSLVERWRDASFAGPPLHKVLVVGVQRDGGRRRIWEDGMVGALTRVGVQATPSYSVFPDKAPSADELAATADLARRKDGDQPVVLVRGAERHVVDEDGPGALALIRPREQDLFR